MDDTQRRLAEARLAEAEEQVRLYRSMLGPPPPPTFTRSEIRDVKFFQEHSREIIDAAAHGRVIDDVTPSSGDAPDPLTVSRQRLAAETAAAANLRRNGR